MAAEYNEKLYVENLVSPEFLATTACLVSNIIGD